MDIRIATLEARGSVPNVMRIGARGARGADDDEDIHDHKHHAEASKEIDVPTCAERHIIAEVCVTDTMEVCVLVREPSFD